MLVGSAVAHAYPRYIAKGYTNCTTCHYSPTGGGMPNSYGHAATQAMFPGLIEVDVLQKAEEVAAKNDVYGYGDDGEPALQWDVGFDARLLFTRAPTEVNADPSFILVPMLSELGGVLAYGPLLAYGTVAPRRVEAERLPTAVVSREHWLLYRLGEATTVRAGRMVQPFGLRIPDHTQPTRENLGFNKYDQSYGAQLDYNSERWMAAAGAFAGDLYLPVRLQERGAAGTVAFNIPSRAAVGVSLLGGRSEAADRLAASVHARVRIWEKLYGMGELASEQRWAAVGEATQRGLYGFAQVGWFLYESLDFYAQASARAVDGARPLTKGRYGAGVNWQALRWVELSSMYYLEEDPQTGRHFNAWLQLHLIY